MINRSKALFLDFVRPLGDLRAPPGVLLIFCFVNSNFLASTN